MVSEQVWCDDYSRVEAELQFDQYSKGREASVLVCMKPASRYKALANGKPVKTFSPREGVAYITVPASNEAVIKSGSE